MIEVCYIHKNIPVTSTFISFDDFISKTSHLGLVTIKNFKKL